MKKNKKAQRVTTEGLSRNQNFIIAGGKSKGFDGFNYAENTLKMQVVCDECAVPLQLYGQNFIESYTVGKANLLRCLCDIHADEMEVNA